MTNELLRLLASLPDSGANDSLEEHFAIADEMLRRAGAALERSSRDPSFAVRAPRSRLLH
jgi:hypothetical protein